MSGLLVRRLEPDDERKHFTCGNEDRDRFFRRYAGQNQFRHHIGTTYIALREQEIVGFVTVAATQIETTELPDALSQRFPYPVPALRLARLGVATAFQGQGIGLSLLKAVFGIARQMSLDMGCLGVVVDAKPEAVDFYERYGFFRIEVVAGELGDRPLPVPMFLPLGAIPSQVE